MNEQLDPLMQEVLNEAYQIAGGLNHKEKETTNRFGIGEVDWKEIKKENK